MMMLTNLMFWGVLLLYGALLVHGVCSGVSVFDLIVGPQQTGNYDGIRIGGVALRAWPLVYYGTGEDPFWSIFSQIFFAGSLIMFAANFIFIGIGIAACIKRKYFHLIPAALLMPLYWLLISLAAWKGFWQIFTKPFYWEKTRHGLTGQTGEEQET